jgi:branched-chain amino acid aminotransferase
MTIRAFQLTRSGLTPLDIQASTLDELTGKLPPGFYTTFSTLNGGTRVLGLQAHLDRLYVPARDLGLKSSIDERTLRRQIAELTQRNLPQESRLRLIMTKDMGDVFIGIQPFVPPPGEIYKNGVHVVTSNLSRHDPRIKGTDFIAESAEQRKLVTGDVYEVLLTKNGRILEGMTSNFYAIKQSGLDPSGGITRSTRPAHSKLITARHGILLGVTRRAVLRLARGEGMSIEYRPPRVGEDFDEAFLTSSSRGVVPVVMIDEKPVGEGRVGAWTKTLKIAYQAYVEERSECIIQASSM